MSSLNRIYTALCIIDPKANEEAVAKYQTLVSDVVQKHGGKVLETFSLGKRKLSHRIGKATEGTYLQVKLELAPKEVIHLEKAARLFESHVRFLILRDALGELASSSSETATTQEEERWRT